VNCYFAAPKSREIPDALLIPHFCYPLLIAARAIYPFCPLSICDWIINNYLLILILYYLFVVFCQFVAAGDHLVHHCPTWQWVSGEEAKIKPYLPKDKQFLTTRNGNCLMRQQLHKCVIVYNRVVNFLEISRKFRKFPRESYRQPWNQYGSAGISMHVEPSQCKQS